VRRHGTQDYYEILNVTEDATDDEVRTAYLKLALKWHPDKHHGNDVATNKFQEISEAYHVLSDPLKRAE
jgi:DnaJ-class molecular chaperone